MIEGQGTLGLEAAAVWPGVERVLVPCGGGGLAAGIALALAGVEVVIVEPEGWDDMARSLASGTIVEVAADAPPTECDALQTKRVSELTFGALRDAGAWGTTVSETEIAAAQRFAFSLGLVVEPGGAVALAALLAGKLRDERRRTLVVVSGGNVDPAAFARVIGGAAR